MPGFDVWSPGKIGGEHVEVIGNDRIELVIVPICPNLRFVSHFVLFPATLKKLVGRSASEDTPPF
jgi:hypothetical protein